MFLFVESRGKYTWQTKSHVVHILHTTSIAHTALHSTLTNQNTDLCLYMSYDIGIITISTDEF